MKSTPLFLATFLLTFGALEMNAHGADSAAARKMRHAKCVAAHPVKQSHEKCFVICDRLDKPHLCKTALGVCMRKGLNVLHGIGQAIENVQECLDPLVSQASRR